MVFCVFFPTPVARAPFPLASSLQHRLVPASNSRCLWWSSCHDVQWWSSGCSAKKRWRWESRGSRIFLGGRWYEKNAKHNIDSFILFWLCYTYTIGFFVRLWEFSPTYPSCPFQNQLRFGHFHSLPWACQTYNADSTACTRACLVGEFDTVVVNGNSGDTLVERIGRGSKITRQQQRIKRYVLWVIHYSRCSGCFLLVNFNLDLWIFVCLFVCFYSDELPCFFFTTLWIQHFLWMLSYFINFERLLLSKTHRIYVWYISLHLVDFYGTCT